MTKQHFQIYLFTTTPLDPDENMEKRKEKKKKKRALPGFQITGLPSTFLPYCGQKSSFCNMDVVISYSCLKPLIVLHYLQGETQTVQHRKTLHSWSHSTSQFHFLPSPIPPNTPGTVSNGLHLLEHVIYFPFQAFCSSVFPV